MPIDLDLGDSRVLVISGPNTGGKTVALKTLGLAALLHQAGLRPPAETAALPVFDDVLADIGDRQSIEMSLSTFSGHVANLVSILSAATSRSLVLVDEVASGTDPVEGSALAQALVARLAGQARLTVVTTHYPELKEWASAEPVAVNAATALDPETNEPLYRITLGRPGTSHALQTAERLGLDRAVVADARSRVSPNGCGSRSFSPRRRLQSERRWRCGRRLRLLRTMCGRARWSSRRRSTRCVLRSTASARRLGPRPSGNWRRHVTSWRRCGSSCAQRGVPRLRRDVDRSLGAASERAARAEQALRTLDEPLPVLAPLAPGDPVEAPEVGVRGTSY